MAKYKIQHWLPSGYMQFFSVSGTPEGRESIVYYSNGEFCKTRPVRKLSCKNYHYSRNNAETVEKSFQQMEKEYPQIIKKILSGTILKRSEYYGLILTMVDLHARNPSYKNLTIEENYKAFGIVSQGLLKEIFKESFFSGYSAMLQNLEKNWVLQPICSPKEEFISSDHPSLIFSIDEDVAFIFLPIHPHYGLIAADKRKVSVVGNQALEKENGKLNALQAAKCLNYVYSNIDLSKYIGEGKSLTKWFKKPRPRGFVDQHSWKPEYIKFNTTFPGGFSFLKIAE